MITKVVAFDVYGTMLSTIGKGLPKRKGLDILLSRLEKEGVILCTCSDGNTTNIIKDLSEVKILEYFNKHFQMPRQPGDFTCQPKDFTKILKNYNLLPEQLLVIGDREKRDILPAKKLGCNAILVPEYIGKGDNYFDINSIKVE